jgi:hypothetical protein
MTELMTKIQPQDLIPIIAILATFGSAVAIAVAIVWRQVRIANIAATLKRDMIDRGMSAEEIRTVLDAGSKA